MITDRPVRVRFAPSPTGFLHIGGARTALFNWIFAKHHGGTFILRIDDTDEERSTEASMREIYDSLQWLGLNWDEGATVGGPHGPYVQSERGNIYRKYVQQLLESDNAYYCYCTPQELTEMREQALAEKRPIRYTGKCRHLTDADRRRFEAEGRKPVVRFKMPEGTIVVQDSILGESKVAHTALQDEVIVKSNGSPLYNLTSTIDDHLMKITHVIRGKDHFSNTPKQILINRALGFETPVFAHLPLVLGSSKGEKLSKRRHGDLVAVGKYRENGYLPEAMINFLVRLGWSYDGSEEIFSVDELIEKFSLKRVGKSDSVFDIKKLQWLNGHYIMKLDLPARTDAVIPFLQRARLLETDLSPERRVWLEKVVEAVGDRLTTLSDITDQASYFFTDDFDYEPQAVKRWWRKGDAVGILQGLREVLAGIDAFDLETVESAIWAYVEEKGIGRVKAMQPLRVALTGKSGGPGLFDITVLLGKAKVIERVDRAIDHLQANH
ncbi:MAG: glutamate--tRNA ligase [Candidatus Poribacteria bacterium]|nr:glutamate--tRNA ligase [Candidatus Poribacteria bacterium]